ncbi:MAG: energy-coupling factor transporter transmembrane component T [Erysipelotrichaceae bacterium]|nr:energy-coupling factor transporter transmembrane component T [Erysipelotrichaceae bacterium]
MNNRFVINYNPGPTFFHKLSGFTKVFMLLVMTVAIISTFDIRILVPLLIINVAIIVSMKPNYKPIIIVFSITFVTVTLIGNIMLFFVSPQAGLNNVGAEHIIWQAGRYYISKEFLWYIFIVFLKRTVSFASVMAFALSTTPSQFASGLNKCGFSYKISTIVSLAYRTIPDIAEDFVNIRNSMMMRGLELEGKGVSFFTKLKNYVLLLVPLIFTAFGKVGNIANAMDLRGYGKNKKRTYYAETEPTKGDKIVRALTVLLLVATVYYVVMYRFINPWPAKFWCPWLSRDEIVTVNAIDTLFFMKWFKK